MSLKKIFQQRKGSAMVLAMVVLVNAMLIIVSISLISIAERKMSGKFKTSTPAFQVADSGLEGAIKKIQDGNPSDNINAIFGPGPGGEFNCPNVPDCHLYFFDSTNAQLGNGDNIGDVRLVRSVGTAGSGENLSTRAVEVSLAQGGNCGWVNIDAGSLQAANAVSYPAGEDHSPMKMCNDAGYNFFSGACKTEDGIGRPIQGSVVSNYALGLWAVSCHFGAGGYIFWTDPTKSQILCCD